MIRKTVLAAIIVAAAVGGGLLGAGILAGSPPTAPGGPGRPVPLAARTGRVTGYIDACEGLPIPGRRYAAGAVTALRGRETWKDTGGGNYRLQLPHTAAAREQVAENQPFSFVLAAGQYVLVARYDGGNGLTFVNVTVPAGQVVRRDFPNVCK
jgi:hypothetical protein